MTRRAVEAVRRAFVPRTRVLTRSSVLALTLILGPGLGAVPAAAADPSAATLADRLTHTIYPEKGIPSGYDAPVQTLLPGTNPRSVQFSFARTADRVVTLLRYDLYDDETSLKKKFPAVWSKPGFDVDANEVVYRMGSYRASCDAYYSKSKAQVVDICGMAIGATVQQVITTVKAPTTMKLDPNTGSNPFLETLRSGSTAFLTRGATFYLEVSGLPP
jgi:hypothetical protein